MQSVRNCSDISSTVLWIKLIYTGFTQMKKCHNLFFCHLLQHLQENDNNILGLLSCESSEIFLRYFKDSLNELVQTQFINHNRKRNQDLPQEFLVNHISGSFVEMVLWWLKDKKTYTRRIRLLFSFCY